MQTCTLSVPDDASALAKPHGRRIWAFFIRTCQNTLKMGCFTPFSVSEWTLTLLPTREASLRLNQSPYFINDNIDCTNNEKRNLLFLACKTHNKELKSLFCPL